MSEPIDAGEPSGASGASGGRGHLSTEQRCERSADLDALSIEETLALINAEDATVVAAVARAMPVIANVTRAAIAALSQGGRLIYLGAGTSGRLGVLDASECPPTFHSDPAQVIGIIAGGDAALRTSSEGKEDDPNGSEAELQRLDVNARDLLVGIAAGGTTPYVLGALTLAKRRGAATAFITCVSVAALRQRTGFRAVDADSVVELLTGPEVVTGSTRMKAGTATKLALNMITTTAMSQLGKTWGNLMVDLRASNAKLRDRALRMVVDQNDLTRDEAERLLDEAGGRVKVALVMARRHVDADEAQRRLDAVGGHLRALLGSPR